MHVNWYREGAMSDQAIVEQAMELFRACIHIIQMETEPDWLHLEHSLAQMKVLFVLRGEEALTVSEVAERLGIGQPTASHLVDRMVQAGYVSRIENPANRRYTLVSLTAQGNTLTERLRQGHMEQLRIALEALPSEELAQVQQGLQILVRALQVNATRQEMQR